MFKNLSRAVRACLVVPCALFLVLSLTHCPGHLAGSAVYCGSTSTDCKLATAMPRCAEPAKVFCHSLNFCVYTLKNSSACKCLGGDIKECPGGSFARCVNVGATGADWEACPT